MLWVAKSEVASAGESIWIGRDFLEQFTVAFDATDGKNKVQVAVGKYAANGVTGIGPTPPPAPEPKNKSLGWLVTAIIIILVVLLIIIIILAICCCRKKR